jgi:fibrillarin-like pre-rRNA processing protein
MIWMDGHLMSPGKDSVYGERLTVGCRVWDPSRSKLAALYHQGCAPPLEAGMKVLYLGAAHGTTVSHVADYVEVVYAVENATRPMQDLLRVAEHWENIIPIFADATRPWEYAPLVEEVDLLYQDVAHPDQPVIALANLPFLRTGGEVILILKTRSIDVTADPALVVAEGKKRCQAGGIHITRECWVAPHYRDHAALLGKK